MEFKGSGLSLSYIDLQSNHGKAFTQIMTGLAGFVASIANASGQIATPHVSRPAQQSVMAVREGDFAQDCIRTLHLLGMGGGLNLPCMRIKSASSPRPHCKNSYF